MKDDSLEECRLSQEIENLKKVMHDHIGELRHKRSMIDHLQGSMAQGKTAMQRKFEAWFTGLRKHVSVENIDEEKRCELYERLTGQAVPGRAPSAEGRTTASASSSERLAASSTPPNQRRTLPSSDRRALVDGRARARTPLPDRYHAGSTSPASISAAACRPRAAAAASMAPMATTSQSSSTVRSTKTADLATDDDLSDLYSAINALTRRP